MINFKKLDLNEKEYFLNLLDDGFERGCGFTYQSFYIWGNQKIAEIHNHAVVLSCFEKCFYPFPVGIGDKKAVIEEIILDATERGIPCLLTGLTDRDEETLNTLFPDRFTIRETRNAWDYVYDINDLADLSGKKYHKKRNHLNNFYKEYPNFKVKEINQTVIPQIKQVAEKWFSEKAEISTEDFSLEKKALNVAFDNYDKLSFDGLYIEVDGEIIAFSFGARKTADTFDVMFEKATKNHQKAYPAINNEFAKFIRNKYPDIKYLNREEDMGIEGLRKAKESYYPHHMVKRNIALLKEEK